MKTKFKHYDVCIIGAGASGLSCALELIKQGLNIIVIEAQDRVGGRAFTRVEPQSLFPFEYGAEFIHGAPSKILEMLEHYKVLFYNVTDNHHELSKSASGKGKSKLKKREHFWDLLQKIVSRIPQAIRFEDLSVAEFLSHVKHVNKKDKDIFQSFVEGFHSGDIHQMSTKGLYEAEEINPEKDLNGSQLFRLIQGYSDLWSRILNSHPELERSLKLRTRVDTIDYSKPIIQVHTASDISGAMEILNCDAVVVSTPISVLKRSVHQKAVTEHDLKWFPKVPEGLSEAVSGIQMGHVQKLIFTFKSRFWEKQFSEPPSFFHAGAEKYFPTWWTSMPLRSPHLIAWQGGPKAEEMAHYSENEKISKALETLSEFLNLKPEFIQNEFKACYLHDWSNDPWVRGAYSYILKDGVSSSLKLTKVFEGRLVFAGEATAPGASRGTVHGAWNSGLRAASQILKLREKNFQTTLNSKKSKISDFRKEKRT